MLAEGPRVAYPIEGERELDDGSRAQRYLTPKGTVVVRRTARPGSYRTYKVWWEVEMAST